MIIRTTLLLLALAVGVRSAEEPLLCRMEITADRLREVVTVDVEGGVTPGFELSFTGPDGNDGGRFRLDLPVEGYALSDPTVRSIKSETTQGITVQSADITHHLYRTEDDIFEWAVELYASPEDSVLSFDISIDKLEFYYQPELTAAEIAAGDERPDSVVGSYAVYHAAGARSHDKVFHLYRPRAWDAGHDTVWCAMRINAVANELTIAVPRYFLDRAEYPITIDPTFGFTTIGGSNTIIPTSQCWGNIETSSQHTAGAAETVDSVYAYMKSYSGSHTAKIGVYTTDANHRPDDRTGQPITITNPSTSPTWCGASAGISLSAGEIYTLALGEPSNSARIYYDAVSAAISVQSSSSTLDSQWDHGTTGNRQLSIYAVYSTTATVVTSSRRRKILAGKE